MVAKGKWSMLDAPKTPGRTYTRGVNTYKETPSGRLHWYAGDVLEAIQTSLKDAYERIGILLQGDIRDNMTTDKPVSLPGEPPAVQTERLIGSIDYELLGEEEGVRVGTNVEYAKYLELGTHRMAARPFLVPAVQRNRRKIKDELKGLVK